MRRLLFFAACTAALAVVASPASAAPQRLAPSTSYVVLYDQEHIARLRAPAVRAAGGVLVAENRRVGVNRDVVQYVRRRPAPPGHCGRRRNKPVGYNAPAARPQRSASA